MSPGDDDHRRLLDHDSIRLRLCRLGASDGDGVRKSLVRPLGAPESAKKKREMDGGLAE